MPARHREGLYASSDAAALSTLLAWISAGGGTRGGHGGGAGAGRFVVDLAGLLSSSDISITVFSASGRWHISHTLLVIGLSIVQWRHATRPGAGAGSGLPQQVHVTAVMLCRTVHTGQARIERELTSALLRVASALDWPCRASAPSPASDPTATRSCSSTSPLAGTMPAG